MSEENKEMEKQVQDAVVDTSASEGREEDRDGRAKGKTYFRKKVCRFCANKSKIDYKDADSLRRYMTERGKILPRRRLVLVQNISVKLQKQLNVLEQFVFFHT